VPRGLRLQGTALLSLCAVAAWMLFPELGVYATEAIPSPRPAGAVPTLWVPPPLTSGRETTTLATPRLATPLPFRRPREISPASATASPTPTPVPTATPQPTASPSGTGYRRGVSLAGAEFSEQALPGTYGTDYTYPTAAELDYYQGKGLTLIRLPFRWERLQPALNAPLDSAELGRIDAVVVAARARNMQVILDVHNYARYYGEVIGSAAVPNAAFADFWRKLAGHYQGESAIWAYGLMNEPHDTGGLWPAAAQAGADGIRAVDRAHTLLVAGDCWSGAWSWQACNATLSVSDPAHNIMYEAHQYFDADSSGTYPQSYGASGAYPTVGVDRVKPFVSWLEQHNARGFLGEYGVPDNDPRWLTVLDQFLSYLDSNGIGGAYWAGGPWWGDYPLSVEPRNGQDRPQMAILVKHPSR